MNAQAKHASQIVDSVAKAVANWTVDLHEETNPDLSNRYGVAWRNDWIGHTLSQVHLLAQAVAVQSCELFANSVRWTFESFRSRAVDNADLLQNIKCMRDVLSKELPQPVGKLSLEYIDAAIAQLSLPYEDIDPMPEGPHRDTVLSYLKAILETQRVQAEAVVLDALDGGLTISDVYEKILAPAQTQLGNMWHRGEASVADEHFGSATTQSIMSQLRPRFKRNPARNRCVVGSATPGDLHEIGLRMVMDLFEIDGWHVIYLGANTPLADVLEMLLRKPPELLALSVSTALTVRDAAELIDSVRNTDELAGVKVIVGGPPFRVTKDLWRELGADGCTVSASDAVQLGNRLVSG